ncbi:MAG: hypothetical protein ACI9DC_003694 [Gammaproteobacteria bacterium]|jgi:hypothetical protein
MSSRAGDKFHVFLHSNNTLKRTERCPSFVIERNFAEEIALDPSNEVILKVNVEVGVKWLYSFLSLDKKKTYCLYEAPNAEAVREAARRANVQADTVVEVDAPIGPALALA